MNKNEQQSTVNSSRRNWLKSVGLGAGAVALSTSVDSIVGDLRAAGMQTEHFRSATPNVNDGLIRLSSNENAFGPSKKAAKAMQS
ncbi:MAG: histidinol-phosphate aminotransferase family protein, partial [Pseudomonadota bacterium]|nr:histidinol-phosphate aminotransferase family protein [Pseudomonadota bacterium]